MQYLCKTQRPAAKAALAVTTTYLLILRSSSAISAAPSTGFSHGSGSGSSKVRPWPDSLGPVSLTSLSKTELRTPNFSAAIIRSRSYSIDLSFESRAISGSKFSEFAAGRAICLKVRHLNFPAVWIARACECPDCQSPPSKLTISASPPRRARGSLHLEAWLSGPLRSRTQPREAIQYRGCELHGARKGQP